MVAFSVFASAAQASLFQFVFDGFLDSRSGIGLASAPGPTPFSGPTAFRFTAIFDNASRNLVAPLPFPGFVAYAPSRAEMTIGNATYQVESFSAATPLGVGVSIFDPRQPFFTGKYAAGFISDPLGDRAGMVADYSGATPGFLVPTLTSTTFTGYNGVGVTSGKCLTNCPPAPPAGPPTYEVTPIHMTMGGNDYRLYLGNYLDEATSDGRFTFRAQILAIPEPGTLALLALGAIAVVVSRRKT
jgi:hypothetical protein